VGFEELHSSLLFLLAAGVGAAASRLLYLNHVDNSRASLLTVVVTLRRHFLRLVPHVTLLLLYLSGLCQLESLTSQSSGFFFTLCMHRLHMPGKEKSVNTLFACHSSFPLRHDFPSKQAFISYRLTLPMVVNCLLHMAQM
jgi:hypothetical protein